MEKEQDKEISSEELSEIEKKDYDFLNAFHKIINEQYEILGGIYEDI